MYHASKWALEGFSQSLAQEVAGFGIHVTLIEPGGYSHRLGRPVGPARHAEPGLRRVRARPASASRRAAQPRRSGGDGAAVLAGRRRRRSRRCGSSSGEGPLAIAKADYEGRLATREQWQHVAELAQG